MIFKVFGPFAVPLDEYQSIPNSLTAFWKSVEEKNGGVSKARGCYVFGINSSGSNRIFPWYIGQTNNQTFDKECFKAHQRNHYSRALNHYERAKPHLFLVAEMKENGKFQKGSAGAAISFVETYLIGFGLWANDELLNKRDTKLYREVIIPGLLNSAKGKKSKSTTEFLRSFYSE